MFITNYHDPPPPPPAPRPASVTRDLRETRPSLAWPGDQTTTSQRDRISRWQTVNTTEICLVYNLVLVSQ